MSQSLSRRKFLKYSGATALALTTVGTGVVHAANSAHYWTYDFDEENFGEETLIHQAVSIAIDRLQSTRIWQNTYDVAETAFLTGNVMDNSNVRDARENRWHLLQHQLYWLSMPNADGDTEPAFPNIHIRARHDEEGGWLGKANLDLVVVHMTDGGATQRGEFDITLNRYYLAGGGKYDDPEEWASTIAHEMCHNLGHLHPKPGEGDPSSDEYQINALNNAVLCNGYYKDPNYYWRSASHMCGGRV